MTQRKKENKPIELRRFDSYLEAAVWLSGSETAVFTERMLQEHAYEAFTEKYAGMYASGGLKYDIDIPDTFFTDGIEYILQSGGKWYVCVSAEKMILDLYPEIKAESDAVAKELYERLEIEKIRKFAYAVIGDFIDISKTINEYRYDYPPLDKDEFHSWAIEGIMDYDSYNGIYDDTPGSLIDTIKNAKTVYRWFIDETGNAELMYDDDMNELDIPETYTEIFNQ